MGAATWRRGSCPQGGPSTASKPTANLARWSPGGQGRGRTWPDVNAIRIKGDVIEELYVRHAGDRSGSRTC